MISKNLNSFLKLTVICTLKMIPVAMKLSAAIEVVALSSVLPADEAVSP